MARHSVEFYYSFSLPADHPVHHQTTYHTQRPEEGIVKQFHFRWIPLDEISQLDIRPPCLRSILADPSHESQGIRHLIVRQ